MRSAFLRYLLGKTCILMSILLSSFLKGCSQLEDGADCAGTSSKAHRFVKFDNPNDLTYPQGGSIPLPGLRRQRSHSTTVPT